MIEIESMVRMTLHREAALTAIPPVPVLAPKRHRFAMFAGITALAVGATVGVAAAAGVNVFGDNGPGAYNAKLGTERLLFTFPTTDGQPIQFWSADAQHDGYCVSFVLPTSPPRSIAGSCSGGRGGAEWNRLGGEWSAGNIGTPTAFSARAPGVASVRLVFPDGTSSSERQADGWVAGEVTAEQMRERPDLVAYDAAGRVLGRFAPPWPVP